MAQRLRCPGGLLSATNEENVAKTLNTKHHKQQRKLEQTKHQTTCIPGQVYHIGTQVNVRVQKNFKCVSQRTVSVDPLLFRLDLRLQFSLQAQHFFLLAAAWVGPGRSALQSAEQWCKRRYGRIHQVGKMSFCDKNMQKGRLKQHTKGGETGNHPQKVPGLQKRALVMSERQPLCRRGCNSIGRRWLW